MKYCVVGGSILEKLGIRKASDLDVIGQGPKNANHKIDWVRGVSDEEIISNPIHHFSFQDSTIYATLNLLEERKKRTKRKRDLEDLKLIKSYRETLFGGCLWGTQEDKWCEILDLISRQYVVPVRQVFTFEDEKKFSSIILSIYETEDGSKKYIQNIKIPSLLKFPKKFLYFETEIPNSNFRKKRNGGSVSIQVEQLKKEIRKKYKHFDGYVHDNVIHIYDNLVQSQAVEKILNENK